MLTHFVQTFSSSSSSIASVVGVGTMIFVYPAGAVLLGIGRIRGHAAGAVHRWSLSSSRMNHLPPPPPPVSRLRKVTRDPADPRRRRSDDVAAAVTEDPLRPKGECAEVCRRSGEQYVDLVPDAVTARPIWRTGRSSLRRQRDAARSRSGPMLGQISTLVDSIPTGKNSADCSTKSFKALNGTGDDLGALFDASGRLAAGFNGVGGTTRALIEDGRPLLERSGLEGRFHPGLGHRPGRNHRTPWPRGTRRCAPSCGPARARPMRLRRLLNQVKPTLPVLLANLSTVGQIGITYNASLEQLLVLLPPYLAATAVLWFVAEQSDRYGVVGVRP